MSDARTHQKPTIQKEAVLTVKVVPGSSQTQIAGMLDSMLKIRISAAPEKGRANECLLDYLAKMLSVRKNTMSIVSGHTSPIKQIRIKGLSIEDVYLLLGIKKC